MKPTKITNRRKFLMAAGLGTAGVAATVVAGGAKQASEPVAGEAAVKTSGYHETEHIQKYYKTTEV
jgi:hypothetical protein